MQVHKLELASGTDPAPRGAARVRVAVATDDGKALNAHFGFARRLMVYEVTARSHRLVQAITFVSSDDDPQDGERIAAKVAALAGCHLVYVLAIGPRAAAKVIEADIFPIKLGAPEPIPSVLARVQAMLTDRPPAWLKRVLDNGSTAKGPHPS